MRPRRVLAALALLGVAWLVTGPTGRPPLYDGIGFPDEPYRYVKPPAGATAARPTVAEDTEPVVGRPSDLTPVSLEKGPQIQVYLPGAALQAPAGAKLVTARAEPLAPVAPLPTDGTIWGNVVRLSVTTAQGPVQVVPSGATSPYLDLRAPTAEQPGPVVEAFRDGAWHQLVTHRDGNDIYGAEIPGIGEYALVRLTDPAARLGGPGQGSGGSSGSASGSALSPIVVIAGGALLVVALGIIAVRFTRRRRPAVGYGQQPRGYPEHRRPPPTHPDRPPPWDRG
jgi:hypothetical protein